MAAAFSALYPTRADVHVMTARGEILRVEVGKVAAVIGDTPVVVCHIPFTQQKLSQLSLPYLDVLELFAFVHPGRFCVPSIVGLAQAVSAEVPADVADYPATLIEVIDCLLADLAEVDGTIKPFLRDLAEFMGQGGKGWGWASHVLAALGLPMRGAAEMPRDIFSRLFARLPETEDPGAAGPHSYHPVAVDDAVARLNLMLHHGAAREDRADQRVYVETVSRVFRAPVEEAAPNLTLIEAGTGIGKTLGYLSPATIWAEQNDTSVWVSTYTKNLQKQMDQELYRLPLVDADRERYAVTRKGRENYLCLLNFAEFAAGSALRQSPQAAVAAGIMMRWVMATRDGDFTGVDYPGWLTSLFSPAHTTMMADRRGECIHAGCEFYNRCFIERSIRKARQARIVVANHTLVMIEAARADADDRLPGYLVFDEGHHLIDAADSVFATSISILEGYDLRRWLVGAESGRKSRLKGIKRRLEDVIVDEKGKELVDRVVQAGHCLPSDRAFERINDGQATGSMERVLQAVAAQVRARSDDVESGYSIETLVRPVDARLLMLIDDLRADLVKLRAPMVDLITYFNARLRDDAGEMVAEQRNRLQSVIMGLERRANQTLAAWIELLADLQDGIENDAFIDWMEITRNEGRVFDIGIFRHWKNPLQPFAEVMRPRLKGAVVTSATLRDQMNEGGWNHALANTGARLLAPDPACVAFPSPFDYAAQTRVLVLTDVPKGNIKTVAGAVQALFSAAGGGALGLFTAIARLRAVYQEIATPLDRQGVHLYAQHVDKLDNGTLVDLFRADRHACLLGTDAMRDGVDVPGDSLRLLVYDRVPWPLASILHKARREVFGGRAYDEQLTRLRLKQAYGRLVRRADDRGVFVMLDSALPSRLHDAFPPGVVVERVSLQDAVVLITDFLSPARKAA